MKYQAYLNKYFTLHHHLSLLRASDNNERRPQITTSSVFSELQEQDQLSSQRPHGGGVA